MRCTRNVLIRMGKHKHPADVKKRNVLSKRRKTEISNYFGYTESDITVATVCISLFHTSWFPPTRLREHLKLITEI